MEIDLALINLQWLICHKSKPNQTKVFFFESHNVIEKHKIVFFTDVP